MQRRKSIAETGNKFQKLELVLPSPVGAGVGVWGCMVVGDI
ncbi:hypothetical protein [Nostoc sp. LPT]|nr:hypothetical protein [Nostoc sp. LPT]